MLDVIWLISMSEAQKGCSRVVTADYAGVPRIKYQGALTIWRDPCRCKYCRVWGTASLERAGNHYSQSATSMSNEGYKGRYRWRVGGPMTEWRAY